MNNQEFFTKSATHLLKQNKKSIWSDECGESCVYRSPDGLMCAVGATIPDSVYSPTMENKTISRLIDFYPDIATLFEGVDRNLLTRMQRVHDGWRVEEWPEQLRSIAREYNLKYPGDEDDDCC